MQNLGQPARRARGVLDLVGRGHDVGGVLGDGQLPPLAIEDPATLTRDRHRLRVLALGIGAEPSTLHALDPGGASDRQTEQQQEAGEQEADPPLDHGVGATVELADGVTGAYELPAVSCPVASRLAAAAASPGLGRR